MDKRVSMKEFLDIYNQALAADDYTESGIYGADVTIHWNGIYCNVGDGATAYNHIISNIESGIEESDDEIDLWNTLYELTADPWTETEEEKAESEKAFYEDLKNGEVKIYLDCLKENRSIYQNENDDDMVKKYDAAIEAIKRYERG